MRYCFRKPCSIQFYYSGSQLPAIWDQLLPEDHFLRSEQLAIHEAAKLPDVSFIYALITEDQKPVAAAYFQVLNIQPQHLNVARLNTAQKLGWNFFVRTFCPKLLVAGHLFRHDVDSFYHDANLGAFNAFQHYHEAIKKAARKSRAMAVLVKDMPAELHPYFQHYAPEYSLMRNDIFMEMDIDPAWENISSYEKALKHKYAQRFRKIRQRWQNLRIEELNATEAEQNKGVIYQLYKQVHEHQQVRLGVLSADYLPKLQAHFPEQLKIWLAYEAEKPVAFFSAWLKKDVFDMFYIGFDYRRNEALQLYFNILFFSVEQAILWKKKKLLLGRTALEAKARLGCKPNYLNTFLYIPNRLLRRVVNTMQHNMVSSEGEWENRHPLKETKGLHL